MYHLKRIIRWFIKIPENIRKLIMEYLDARHPEYCRAELVMWALGYHTIKATFSEGGCLSQLCRGNNPQDSYCGKCACTGRLYRDQDWYKEITNRKGII